MQSVIFLRILNLVCELPEKGTDVPKHVVVVVVVSGVPRNFFRGGFNKFS